MSENPQKSSLLGSGRSGSGREVRLTERFAWKPTRLHFKGRTTGWVWLRRFIEFEALKYAAAVGDPPWAWVSLYRVRA